MTTPNPHRFGSLIFCPQCSSLLDLPGDDDEIICNHCGNVEPASGKNTLPPSVSPSRPGLLRLRIKKKLELIFLK
jgi:DNA-directed RNA polymerase I subunit RPA12